MYSSTYGLQRYLSTRLQRIGRTTRIGTRPFEAYKNTVKKKINYFVFERADDCITGNITVGIIVIQKLHTLKAKTLQMHIFENHN